MAETSPVKKRIGFIVRVLVGVGILYFVLTWIDSKKMWKEIQKADISLALAFFPLLGLTGLIGAIRWRMLLKCQEIDVSLWETIKLTFLGFFFCIFLPGLTGDVVKGVYAAQHTPHKTRAAMSILVDRLVGMNALGILSLVTLLTCADTEMARKGTPIIIVLLVMCVGVTIIFLRGRSWGLDRLAKRFPMGGVSEEILKASDFYISRKNTLLAAFLVSFIPYFGTVLLYYGYGLSLNIEQMAFTDYMFAVPIVGFIGALPVSIMLGLGTGEWSTAWLFSAKGVAKDLSVALSLMVRATIVMWSLPGGAIALFYRVSGASGGRASS